MLTAAETVAVSGSDYRAVAGGTSTLLQALRKEEQGASLPRMRVKDWPHTDYVGTMLDVARQNHPVEAVKQVVDLCRLYRVRYLHLHLTDDQGWTFPSTAYPQLGTKNQAAHGGVAPAVYSLAELRDLVAYADALRILLASENVGVSVVLPGHVRTRQTEAHVGTLAMIMGADEAAAIIKRGLDRRQAMIAFPRRAHWLVRLASVLPWRLKALATRGDRFHVRKDSDPPSLA